MIEAREHVPPALKRPHSLTDCPWDLVPGSRACSLSPTHVRAFSVPRIGKKTAEINRGVLCMEEGKMEERAKRRLRDHEQTNSDTNGLNESPPRICIITSIAFFFLRSLRKYGRMDSVFAVLKSVYFKVRVFAFVCICLPF